MRAAAAAAMILAAAAAQAEPVTCREADQGTNRYAVCEVDAATADLRLFLADDQGVVYGQFFAIDRALRAQGQRLAFAMNAGMYHEDRAPVGYYVENGVERQRLMRGASPGNFGLVPNGLLCIGQGEARVIETEAFAAAPRDCRFATQSGPMLVIDGDLHPRFLAESTSRFVRNGVGTSDDGTRAVFVISRNPVTFHEFGRFFRDDLRLNQALYFDGSISRLYAPQIGRNDAGFRMGPVVGVVAPLGD